MRIEKGKTRVAIIAGEIAIKFPRIYALEIFKCFFWYLREGYADVKYFLGHEIKFMLWRGIVCNFREFLFYRTYRLSILAPTYFSLFGLINIQKAGTNLKMDDLAVWEQIYELTKRISFKDHDPHTFAEAENYCVIDHKLAMVDYGDFQTQWVLKRYGGIIFKKFNLNYRRKKFEI